MTYRFALSGPALPHSISYAKGVPYGNSFAIVGGSGRDTVLIYDEATNTWKQVQGSTLSEPRSSAQLASLRGVKLPPC